MSLGSHAPPSFGPESGARAPMLPVAPPSVPRPISNSGTTAPEMPAVRGPISELPGDGYDEWDETTDIVRLTEVGEPPDVVDGRDRAVLLRADGVTAGQVCSVAPAGAIIGRAPDAGVSVDDPGVSRAHARLTPTPSGRHLLEDLGSRNGTFVRGKRVQRALLEDGDMVQLGPRVSFRYVVVDRSGEALFRQLYQSSVRDALTGAYNRRHFDERFAAELAFAERHQSDLSLLIFDVDHFKKVNDVYGHPAGDAVLSHVVRLAQRQLRAEDVFARYGGEEFAVLLRGIGPSGAVRAAERIRTTIEVIPGAHEGRVIPVTISGGIASVSEPAERSPEALVSRADARLYRAKHEGRNRMLWRD